jgi:phage antirepressor YoqD-like protein
MQDGARVLRGRELSEFKSESNYTSNAGRLTIFPKRSVLRVGMLLRKSRVAEEVRNQLLNIEEVATKEQKMNRIEREQQITTNIGKAIAAGDVMALAKYSTELTALKNEHIKEVQPKVDGYNEFLEKADNLTFRQTAQLLGLPERKLIRYLEDNRYVYRDNGFILPYADRRLDGYFSVKRANSDFWQQTLITPAGLDYLRRKVAPKVRTLMVPMAPVARTRRRKMANVH